MLRPIQIVSREPRHSKHTHLGSCIPQGALPERILADNNLALASLERKTVEGKSSNRGVDIKTKLDPGGVGVGSLANDVQVLAGESGKMGGENLAR